MLLEFYGYFDYICMLVLGIGAGLLPEGFRWEMLEIFGL